MKKQLIIINLIIKTLFELIFVFLFVGTIGLVIFITTYFYKTIQNAVSEYKQLTGTY